MSIIGSGCALFLVLLVLLHEDAHALPPPPPMPPLQRRHVCQSPRIFAKNIERPLQRDVVFKAMQSQKNVGQDELFENRWKIHRSSEDCSKYKYRPIRLLAFTELMSDVGNSPAFAHAKEPLRIKLYKKIVDKVLREFEGIFEVPYNHVGTAGDEKVSDLLYRAYTSNASTLNDLNVDMVFSVTYGDPKRSNWKTCTGYGSTLAYATTLRPYVVKLPRGDCDNMNKDRNMVLRHRAGLIAICPRSDRYTEAEVSAIVRHELLHAMGFNPDPCILDVNHTMFHMETNNYYSIPSKSAMTKDPQFEWGSRYVMTFTGGRVVEEARLHYNCSDLESVNFEDDDQGVANSFHLIPTESEINQRRRSCTYLVGHWEEYHAGNALMGPIVDPYNALSSLTAAFFEDVYMYKVNRKPIKDEMQTYTYGKNYGCEFIKRGCRSWIELNQQLSDENDRRLCSFPVVSRDVLEGDVAGCYKGEPLKCIYVADLCGDSGCYNPISTVLRMHSGLENDKAGAKYYYTTNKPVSSKLGNQSKADGPFSMRNERLKSYNYQWKVEIIERPGVQLDEIRYTVVHYLNVCYRNYGAFGKKEFCPLWTIDRIVETNYSLYGSRPSYCPTMPGETELTEGPHSHHLFSGCVQEGNTGSNYDCQLDHWSPWSECVACFTTRQRYKMCTVIKDGGNNCTANFTETGHAKCPDCKIATTRLSSSDNSSISPTMGKKTPLLIISGVLVVLLAIVLVWKKN